MEKRKRVSAKQRRIAADRKRRGLAPKRKGPKRPGGLWRAFISKETRGGHQKADFKELSDKYRALTAEERGALRPEAVRATAAGRLGAAPFGVQPREAARVVERGHKRIRGEALAEGAIVLAPPPALAM